MTATPEPVSPAPDTDDVAVLLAAAEHARRALSPLLGETAARWLTAEADCHSSADEVGQAGVDLLDTLAGDPSDTSSFRVVVSTLPSAVAFARQVLALPVVVAPGVGPLAAYVESWLNAYTDDDLPALVSDIAPKLAASLDEDVLAGLRADLAEIRSALVAADPKADLPGYAHVPSVDIVRELAAARDTFLRNWEQARADVDRLTAELLVVPRANDTVITQVVEAVLAAGDWNGGIDAARKVFRERAVAARVSGARTIPDDAAAPDELAQQYLDLKAERDRYKAAVERWHLKHETALVKLTRFAAGLQAEEATDEPDRSDWLQGHDAGLVEASVRAGNDLAALLADLGATPTTDPAPAAADGEVRALLVHPAAWNRLVDWLTARGLTVDGVGELEGIPTYSMGISDALAEAARVDTAPPDTDGYNSDLGAGFLRPSTPTEEV